MCSAPKQIVNLLFNLSYVQITIFFHFSMNNNEESTSSPANDASTPTYVNRLMMLVYFHVLQTMFKYRPPSVFVISFLHDKGNCLFKQLWYCPSLCRGQILWSWYNGCFCSWKIASKHYCRLAWKIPEQTWKWLNIKRILHGHAWIWILSLSGQLDISRVSAASEWDFELNTRR